MFNLTFKELFVAQFCAIPRKTLGKLCRLDTGRFCRFIGAIIHGDKIGKRD